MAVTNCQVPGATPVGTIEAAFLWTEHFTTGRHEQDPSATSLAARRLLPHCAVGDQAMTAIDYEAEYDNRAGVPGHPLSSVSNNLRPHPEEARSAVLSMSKDEG
jgi:hypothetical protein